jgi:hypothetical protein
MIGAAGLAVRVACEAVEISGPSAAGAATLWMDRKARSDVLFCPSMNSVMVLAVTRVTAAAACPAWRAGSEHAHQEHQPEENVQEVQALAQRPGPAAQPGGRGASKNQ